MQTVTTIGLDIAKSVFQVHGVDAAGQVVIRRQLKRRQVLTFFQKLPDGLQAFVNVPDDARDASWLQKEVGAASVRLATAHSKPRFGLAEGIASAPAQVGHFVR